jgi:hypothetical protein
MTATGLKVQHGVLLAANFPPTNIWLRNLRKPASKNQALGASRKAGLLGERFNVGSWSGSSLP